MLGWSPRISSCLLCDLHCEVLGARRADVQRREVGERHRRAALLAVDAERHAALGGGVAQQAWREKLTLLLMNDLDACSTLHGLLEKRV